jgi:acetyl esterase/lipase
MNRRFHIALARAALAGAALLTASAYAADASTSLTPVEAFFSPPAMSGLTLSPNGEYFAMLVRAPVGRRQLVVGPTSDPGRITVAAAFFDADIVNAEWADNDHLVYSNGKDDESAQNQKWTGLFVVKRDGSEQRPLIKVDWRKNDTSSHIVKRILEPNHFLERTLRDGTSDVIVSRLFSQGQREWEGIVPLRLDTGSVTTRELVPKEVVGHATDWLFDDHGRPRMVVIAEGDTRALKLAPDDASKPASEWRTIWTGPRFIGTSDAMDPLAVGPDGTLYVVASNGDTTGLFKLDKDGHRVSPPIVSVKGFDFDGQLVFNGKTGALAGVHYAIDASGTAWLDPAFAAVQAKVDAKLPGLVNRVEPADCGCSTHYAVIARSDHQPPVYMLYDSAKDELVQLGQQRPDIDARRMADTDFYRFKARDGREIPAYVTHPKGKGPWPTVVLVHGGPWVRGAHWEWASERQFLASRGYLVVEPEYRGSTGYGSAHFMAGLKQWGAAMQDDVADATTWAAAKGWSDPKRVCIMGGSYGGYSTLMGLVRDGALYRCGIAAYAPTDLIAMYDYWWSDAGNDWQSFGMPQMMGDKVKDADLLRAASPVLQAAKITKPLMLVQGGLDRRVPYQHAEAMRDALKSAGHPPTWVPYSDEGHGLAKPENRYDLYQRVEAFLAENLK